jgi:hypothetical protein
MDAMGEPSFDIDQVFDEDYLYFYEPRAEAVTRTRSGGCWSSNAGPPCSTSPAATGESPTRSRSAACGFFDHDGEPLTARSPRMVTLARRG